MDDTASTGSVPSSNRKLHGGLLPNTELLDDNLVSVDILPFKVIQKTAALAHKPEQSPPRMVILGVGLEVIGKVSYSLAQQSDLHFGGTRIIRVVLIGVYYAGLSFFC